MKYEFDFGADGSYDLTNELVDPDADGPLAPFWTGGGGPGGTGEPGKGAPWLADFYYYAPGSFDCIVRVTDRQGGVGVSVQRTVEVTEVEKWQSKTVVTGVQKIPFGSLAEPWGIQLIDVNGRPGFEFSTYQTTAPQDGFNRHDWTVSLDPTGQTWTSPVEVSRYENNDHINVGAPEVVIGGNPAGCFTKVNGGSIPNDLAFVRANNPNGQSWAAPVILQTDAQDVGAQQPIEIDGKPEVFADDGVYIAQDAIGSAWDAAQPYENLNLSDGPGSIMLIDGIPTFLRTTTFGDLLYYRAQTPEGVAWEGPELANFLDGAQRGRMTEVLDKPGLMYYNPTLRALTYKRGLDAAGSAWGSPVVLSYRADNSTGTFDELPHMVVIDGRPAVFFGDRISGKNLLTVACNPAGTAWTEGTELPQGFATSLRNSNLPVCIGDHFAFALSQPDETTLDLYDSYITFWCYY